MNSLRGFFGIYCVNEFFLVSNYGETLLDCINGLAYHILQRENYFTKYHLNDLNYVSIPKNLEYEIHCSDFIERGYRHWYHSSFTFSDGTIHLFKYVHGSLNPKKKKMKGKEKRLEKKIEIKK